MANCHNLFKDYNSAIRLTEKDRSELEQKRVHLISKITRGFNALSEPDLKIDFRTQGSFVMDTIIDPENKDYDLDEGIYFIGSNSVDKVAKPEIFHQFVVKSLKDFGEEGTIEQKDTCVRVKYKAWGNFTSGFHIDLPIYYANSLEKPFLAHKVEGWMESNPVDFIEWFENRILQSKFEKAFIYESLEDRYFSWANTIRKDDHQLRRIVRYLKGWGDFQKNGRYMPPGIVLSILTAENFQLEERDDKAFLQVLKGIHAYFQKYGIQCIRPTTKVENIMHRDKPEDKETFKKDLEKFIQSAEQAINNPNQKEACLKWQRYFGPRFSCALALETPEGAEKQKDKPFIGASHRTA